MSGPRGDSPGYEQPVPPDSGRWVPLDETLDKPHTLRVAAGSARQALRSHSTGIPDHEGTC